jgi:2-C-methyl-D-erythritol 4-phosphate cytidylyltransferase
VSNKKFALIVAGGSGKRMNSVLPKQFLSINGKPLLMLTIEAFLKNDHEFEFFVVLPEAEMDSWKNLCLDHSFQHRHTLVSGGSTRFHSVKYGLGKIREEGIVFIHDGVRPLVSSQTIDNCYLAAVEKGNALPVISPSESLRESTGHSSRAADRSRFFLVQTPQTFRLSLIKKAYSCRYQKKFTDDASVLEAMGHPIYMVEGNRENIKITFPQDLVYAENYLRRL